MYSGQPCSIVVNMATTPLLAGCGCPDWEQVNSNGHVMKDLSVYKASPRVIGIVTNKKSSINRVTKLDGQSHKARWTELQSSMDRVTKHSMDRVAKLDGQSYKARWRELQNSIYRVTKLDGHDSVHRAL